MSESTGTHSWDRVSQFTRGKVYLEGNLNAFMKLTGWHGSQVLYFGDHVYSDLAVSGQNCLKTINEIRQIEFVVFFQQGKGLNFSKIFYRKKSEKN